MARTNIWIAFYIGDYLADTMRLSTTEHGALLLLLMEYYRQGPLPDDDSELADICKMTLKEWMRISKRIRSYFAPDNGLLRQKRCDLELKKARDISEKRRSAAYQKHSKSSANAGEEECKSDANADDLHTHTRAQQSQSQSQKGETKATPSPAVPASLWADGLGALREMTGRSEASCRAQIGKWRKNLGDDDATLFGLITECRNLAVADPVAWMTKAIDQRTRRGKLAGKPSNLNWMAAELRAEVVEVDQRSGATIDYTGNLA